jgi:ribosome-associated toxin RatA of RatAB toxin-antitoxin module
MHSTIGIDIAAPPELVFGLARHVERWERLLPHYARSRTVGAAAGGAVPAGAGGALVTDFVARRTLVPFLGLGLPVAWRARTWAEPETCRLRFVHVAGATKGMDVTWRIEPSPTGCHVSIEHDFRPRLPGFATFVDRAFTRPIAGRTLATFKALAEALAETPLVERWDRRESERPVRTNPRP